MSQPADRALNSLFNAEREAMGVAPHATPTYFALLDRLAHGHTPAPGTDVPQGSSPLAGTGAGLAATLAAGAATLVVVAGIWGGSLLLDRDGDARATLAEDRASTPTALIVHEPPRATALAPVAAPTVAANALATHAALAPEGNDAARTPVASSVIAEHDTARRVPASARAEDLAEELRLLSAARAAWKAGRTADAFARLADHEQRFPHGLLREDRGALEAVLLCETGRLTEGRAKARRFLAQHPRSTLVDTVRNACP